MLTHQVQENHETWEPQDEGEKAADYQLLSTVDVKLIGFRVNSTESSGNLTDH